MVIHRTIEHIHPFAWVRLWLLVAAALLAGCSAEPAPSQPLAAQPTTIPSATPTTPTVSPIATAPTATPKRDMVLPIITETTRIAPIQSLQTERIVDQPLASRRALTYGTQKYKTAVWGPSSDWIAAVPQDGPGLDIVHATTGEVRTVVTDTYVLEPLWLASDALIVHRVTPSGDELVRFNIAENGFDTAVVTTDDGPVRAVGSGGGAIAWSNPAQQLMLLTGQSLTNKVELPLKALVTAPAPQLTDHALVAINPLVANLEDIQTLVIQPQPGAARASAISEIGEGLWLPRWAPDNAKLVLTSIRGRVVASAVDGSGRYDLGPGDSPAWSPDSTRLAYAGTSAGEEFISRDIHVVDWQGRGPRLRLTNAGDEEFYTSPSWAADGTRLAFVEIDSGQLFVGVVPQD